MAELFRVDKELVRGIADSDVSTDLMKSKKLQL